MLSKSFQASQSLAYVSAIVAVVIWGASPAATLIASYDVAPATVGMVRTLAAAALVLPPIALLRLKLPSKATGWGELFVSGIAGFVVFPILFSIGMAQTATAHAALILAAAPVFTGLLGFIVSNTWPTKIWWIGAAIALCGEATLIFARTPSSQLTTATFHGDIIVLASVVLASAGYVAGGRLSTRIGTWAATAWALVIGGFVLATLAIPSIAQIDWWVVRPASLGALAFLAIGVSVIGYAAWYWAMGRAGPAAIAPVQFAQPIVSLLLAVMLFHEHLTVAVLTATLLILLGVVLCKRS